jgi:hypothetical protein
MTKVSDCCAGCWTRCTTSGGRSKTGLIAKVNPAQRRPIARKPLPEKRMAGPMARPFYLVIVAYEYAFPRFFENWARVPTSPPTIAPAAQGTLHAQKGQNMLNITETYDISIIGPGESPTADLLPIVDWDFKSPPRASHNLKRIAIHQGDRDSEPSRRRGWFVTPNHDVVSIRRGNSVVSFALTELPALSAASHDLGD